MPWHYVNENREQAEVPDDNLEALVETGAITRETLIWQDGMGDWLPASQVKPELFGNEEASPSPIAAQPAPQPQAAPAQFVSQPPTSGLAIAALVCGILSVISSWCYGGGFVVGVPAVVCGHMALSRIKMANGQIGGRGLAIAGLVTGYLGILVSAGFILMMVLFVGAAAAGGGLVVP